MIAAALLACAVNVSPITMEAVIRVESGGNPFAIHVNKYSGPQPRPVTQGEAVSIAEKFIHAGYTVDMGLAQVNSVNLSTYGLSIADAFDACKNVATGGAILASFYWKAAKEIGEGQAALLRALSYYNSGSPIRGFTNGYVGRYVAGVDAPRVIYAAEDKVKKLLSPYEADTEVYSREQINVEVD